MIVWITKPLALAIHDRQLSEHGGSPGVRDETLLDSALARTQQTFAYTNPSTDIAALAASLTFGLARNHPFVDGNKRTAHVCYRTFLMLNDVVLDAGPEAMYTAMLGLADGTITEVEFADWLREHIMPDEADDHQRPAAVNDRP